MSAIIFTGKATKNNTEYDVSFEATDGIDINSFGILTYKAKSDTDVLTVTFSFDIPTDKLSFKVETALSVSKCLILCGIALAGPVLDCYKHNKKWKDFIECLEKQGHTLGAAAITCIAGCDE